MSDLLTPADLASRFDVKERKVLEWRRVYDWPCVRLGRTFRFTQEQYEQILLRHSGQPVGVDRPSVAITGQTARSASRRRSS